MTTPKPCPFCDGRGYRYSPITRPVEGPGYEQVTCIPCDGSGKRQPAKAVPKTHDLKCWPQYFAALWTGQKTFEIRRNDRDYEVGDLLFLREWDPATGRYTDRGVMRRVVFITDFEQKPEFVVMGIAT